MIYASAFSSIIIILGYFSESQVYQESLVLTNFMLLFNSLYFLISLWHGKLGIVTVFYFQNIWSLIITAKQRKSTALSKFRILWRCYRTYQCCKPKNKNARYINYFNFWSNCLPAVHLMTFILFEKCCQWQLYKRLTQCYNKKRWFSSNVITENVLRKKCDVLVKMRNE